jgi:hypothetical protein
MSVPSSPLEVPTLPAQVWASLTTDLKQQVIFLMAQLAFNLLADQSHWLAKEPEHAQPIQQSQNPA